MSPENSSLSLCMIVKDEASNLIRCLASVYDVVDEMIVVDTGSTDETPCIARVYGAQVYHFPWQDDFALARNESLAHASGEWILYLDADEALDPETRQRVRAFVSQASADAYQVRIHNFHTGDGRQGYTESSAIRLFRNRSAYRFELPIHEQIVYNIRRSGGQVQPSDLLICHYGYSQVEAQGDESREQRNLRILEKGVDRLPEDVFLRAKLGLAYYSAGEYALAKSHLRRVAQALDRDARALNPTTSQAVQACLKQLSAVERPSPVELLDRILAAEDLQASFRRYRDFLDKALLDLVQANAASARSDGFEELADGLDLLGAYVRDFV